MLKFLGAWPLSCLEGLQILQSIQSLQRESTAGKAFCHLSGMTDSEQCWKVTVFLLRQEKNVPGEGRINNWLGIGSFLEEVGLHWAFQE